MRPDTDPLSHAELRPIGGDQRRTGTNGRRAMAIGGAATALLAVLVAWGALRARAASRRQSARQGDASSLHGPTTVPDVIDAVGAADVLAPRALAHESTTDGRPLS